MKTARHYNIIVKYIGHVTAEYFVKNDEKGFWTSCHKTHAFQFETFDDALDMYYEIEERANKMNAILAII